MDEREQIDIAGQPAEAVTPQPKADDDVFSIDAILRENKAAKEAAEQSDLPRDTVSAEAEASVPDEAEKADETEKSVKPEWKASKPAKPPKKKRLSAKQRGCLVTFIWVAIILVISLTLAGCLIVGTVDYLGIGKEKINGDKDVQIEIAQGSSVDQIAKTLKEHGILLSTTLFKAYSKLDKSASTFQYGCHDFNTRMGYEQIVKSLQKPAKAEDIEIVIKDTSTVDGILKLLEKEGVCTAEDLKAEMQNGKFNSPLLEAASDNSSIYYRFEGYLLPDTYYFYKNDDPNRVLQKFLTNLENKFPQKMRDDAQAKGYTTNQILTMASIIELESCGYYDEMSKIASVFYNRLNKWPAGQRKLQSDPTMNYPYGDGAYNTYQVEGLPPGPLCNPSKAAIEAAVYPEENFDYYFFVTDKNFKFYYNKTDAEHTRTIANLKRQKLWG